MWFPSISVAASSVGVPWVGARFPLTVTAAVVFPPSSTPPVFWFRVTAPSMPLPRQGSEPSPPSPMRTNPLLLATLMAPRIVLLLHMVKGALEVEVMAPVTVESTTESAAPEDTVIAPFWFALFRRSEERRVGKESGSVWGPEQDKKQASVRGTSPAAHWAVSVPSP